MLSPAPTAVCTRTIFGLARAHLRLTLCRHSLLQSRGALPRSAPRSTPATVQGRTRNLNSDSARDLNLRSARARSGHARAPALDRALAKPRIVPALYQQAALVYGPRLLLQSAPSRTRDKPMTAHTLCHQAAPVSGP